MAHEVFISYSSKDKPIADAVCANIEAADVRCWIAPRDIAPGEDWPTAITKAISQSRIMVLVFSSSSNSSEDVSRELFLASNSKLIIIPFKIENIEPEPGKQYYLARTHWLDAMNPPTKEQIRILVRRVVSILPATGPVDTNQVDPVREPQPPPQPEPTPGKSRSKYWPAWTAIALVGLGILAWVIFGGGLNLFRTVPAPLLKTNTPVPIPTTIKSSTPTNPGLTEFPPDVSMLSGTWTGTVANGDFQILMTITVYPICTVGQVCAHFDNPTLPCSGDFVFFKMTEGMYEFKGANKDGTCGAAQDFLQAQPDGTLLYLSLGDFGETRGFLQKISEPEFSTDFNDPSFNGTFDPNAWYLSPDITLTSIEQLNGAMVFSKPSTSGTENGNLKTTQLWSLGEFSFFEARLMLDPEHTGGNGNVAITFWDLGAWWAGCGIQVGDPTPHFWCGQGSQSGNEFWSGSPDSSSLEYGKWYTVRLEYNSQTNEFQCYLDGNIFTTWQPANRDELLRKTLLVTIGIWAGDGTSITGYVDDVRVVK